MHSNGSNNDVAPRFDARYSDGQTAGTHDVDVRMAPDGLHITTSHGGEPIVWAYSDLTIAEPLRKNSIEALISSKAIGGATLFVPGSTFARALAKRAPHLTTRRERWRNTRPWLLATLAFAAIVIIIYVADLTPARYVASAIPDKLRHSIGHQSIESLIDGRGTCVATDGRQALDRLVSRLAGAARIDMPLEVTVADWGLLNAFTAPGAQIIVTRGLITRARSPDEFAGVVAHEIGHGVALHPETAIVRALGLSAAIELMAGGGGGTVANFGVLLAQLSYTRSAEREADEQALRILKQAEISPKGLETFFERISRLDTNSSANEDSNRETNGGSWSVGMDILRTHPQPADRLARVRKQPSYPATPAMSDADWKALKDICSQTEGRSAERMGRTEDNNDGNESGDGSADKNRKFKQKLE